MASAFDPDTFMPKDWRQGQFVGRVDFGEGPTPVMVRDGRLFDMSPIAPTVSQLVTFGELPGRGHEVGALEEVGLVPPGNEGPVLLSPVDLQCVKAAGVTFAVSTLERVIEERARGKAGEAAAIRAKLESAVGAEFASLVPGSEDAAKLKATLI